MDLFYSADYIITGKHSEMLKQLQSEWKLFPYYVDVLPVAAIIGVLMNRYSDRDNSEAVAKLPYAALSRKSSILDKAFQLVIMNTPKISDDEDRINRLFRLENVQKEDRELFEGYVRGGIEYLYEVVTEDSAVTDSDRMMNLEKMVEDINEKNASVVVTSILDLIEKR